ncbi:MAG: DUF4159 domain-containing protein [Pseudomonadota bacterium]
MLGLGFVAPAVLAGLIALPILWWLLRAIPPSPKTEVFAGVRLLLGLEDPEREAERTPWWLLALRIAAVAALIIGFAQPILNPPARLAGSGDGPVLILMDAGWASAPDWQARLSAAGAAVDEAGRQGRSVILWRASEEQVAPPPQMTAPAARAALDGSQPRPIRPDRAGVLAMLDDPRSVPPGETVWLHDGIAHPGEGDAAARLAERLAGFGPLRLMAPATPARAVLPPRLEDGRLVTTALRTGGAADDGVGSATLVAIAAVPGVDGSVAGERRLGVAEAAFEAGDAEADAVFDLPAELIGSIARITLADAPSPGGTALADGAVRRARVAVVDPASEGEVLRLTSARHYLSEALQPSADVRVGTLAEVVAAEPAAIFLADQGEIDEDDREALTEWMESGGLLVRFAGPRLAAAVAEAARAGTGLEDLADFLPVRLRRGGRTLGGALAWGDPRTLGPFSAEGPFRRLVRPDEVAVRTQVLAEPSPDLAPKIWASLDDGTPLVTAEERGDGRLVLFHVSADAEWSSLPLSGLFVEMLRELLTLAPGRGATVPDADELGGTLWRLEQTLATDGTLLPVPGTLDPMAGDRLAAFFEDDGERVRLLPGLYARADGGPRAAGAAESLVVNLHRAGDTLAPFPPAPSGAVTERLGGAEALKLAAPLLLLAVMLAAVDAIATLWLSGRLPRLGQRGGQAGVQTGAASALMLAIGLAALALAPGKSFAQDRSEQLDVDVSTAAETTLGFVLTGVPSIDRVSERAMIGLGAALTARTAVEPGRPVGVDPERDEMALLSVVYMPLTRETLPTDVALEKLERYIANGGLLLIDTKSGAAGLGTAGAADMRQVARALNLPPLAPVGPDHVLTRTFYLLDRFPGRWRGGRLWAEVAPEGRQEAEAEGAGLPQFDRIDDNVSPVVVGSADWASAWAVDEQGRPMFPVGRPGDRQREMALRFGVNLVLYALTGNYKSDQVHAPAVLERLGQ